MKKNTPTSVIIPRTPKEIQRAIVKALEGVTTPQDARRALENMDTAETAQEADFIITLFEGKGVDPTAPEIAYIIQQSKEWKAAEAAQEHTARQENTVAELTKKITHYHEQLKKGVSPKDTGMGELTNDIAIIAAMLTATGEGRKRFTTYSDFLSLLQKYDPDHDLTLSLFAGLRCPNGTVSIIGARPGGGKTSVMINATRETLTTTNRAAFFVNLEMNSRQVLTNLCLSIMYADAKPKERAELAAIDATVMEFNRSFKWTGKGAYPKSPLFAALQLKAMKKVEAALDAKRLYVYDGIGNTLEGIMADIETHAKEGDVILLDYMQRTPPPHGQENQTRQVQVQLASRALLNAAIETQCVIIAGAQFNRDGEKDGKEATLAGFRESGDIEQDAHNAIAIEKEKDTETRYIRILKEREGGSKYQRMEIEIMKQYVYWTGGVEYTRSRGRNGDSAMQPEPEQPKKRTWKDI
jgi:hypothetical protein